MELEGGHINREAHDKTKGFRLQKLRAVEMMLDSEKLPESTVMFWAIEYGEDVFEDKEGEVTYEEDKAYDENTTFTFNNIEVRKALVSFVDLWIKSDYSQSIQLNFYSTNKIGKEKQSNITKTNNIELPDYKLLEIAKSKDLSDEFIDVASSFVIHEIADSYGKESAKCEKVKAWNTHDWKTFFKLINWKFGMENVEDKEQNVLLRIKSSKWFSNVHHADLEGYIKSSLIDLLDERQDKTDLFAKLINKSDIQLVFIKLQKGNTIKKNDPIWEMWENIQSPNDKRSVKEKLVSRWSDISKENIEKYATKAVEGGIERSSHESENSFKAFRYRIYQSSSDRLSDIINDNSYDSFTPDELIDEIFNSAKLKVTDMSRTYSYGYDSDTLIYNVILELVNSCYLAFDEE